MEDCLLLILLAVVTADCYKKGAIVMKAEKWPGP